jgi:predicted O-methyltransferase YrrM
VEVVQTNICVDPRSSAVTRSPVFYFLILKPCSILLAEFMNPETWTAVDRYLTGLLEPADPVLESALAASAAAGLPPINVTPAQGKLLQLLARMQRARNILEIGTLGGYSTIWLARSLPPGGRLITLEFDPKHAEIARGNFARANLAGVVDLRVGRALDILPQLAAGGCGPFDLIFIDADKPGTADYFVWALKLSRPGSLIVVDNVVRKGAVIDAASDDPNVRGMRRFVDVLALEKRVSATVLQTVGSKGYDGFALAFVMEPGR